MDKELLIKVLSSSNKVVMPGFGVFLRKNLDEQLIFSPFLRNDDGYLVSVVAKEYSLEEAEAKEMVYSFVEHIKDVLASKKRFIIDRVGTLFVDENGAIAMVMDTSWQITEEVVEPAVVEEAVVSEEVVDSQKVGEVVSEPEPVVEQEEATETETETETEAVQEEEPVVQEEPVQPIQPVQPKQVKATNPLTMGGQRIQSPSSITPKPLSMSQHHQHQQTPQPQQPRYNNRPAVQQPMGAGAFHRPVVQPGIVKPRVQPPTRPVQAANPSVSTPVQEVVQPQQQRPQGNVQQSGAATMANANNNKPKPNMRRKPQPRKKSKTDMWLTIAIIAAVVVIGLMIFGILTAQQASEFTL